MGRRWSQNSILNPSATHLEADGCRCLAKTISRHRRNKNVTKLIRPSVIEIRNQKLQREPFHLDFHIESFAKRTMYAWMYDDIYVYCTPSKRNWKFLLLEWSFPFNITIMLDSNFTSFIFLILLLVFKQSTISMRNAYTYMQMFSLCFYYSKNFVRAASSTFQHCMVLYMRGIVVVYIVVRIPFTWLVGKMCRK
jgi:hypothetical protein